MQKYYNYGTVVLGAALGGTILVATTGDAPTNAAANPTYLIYGVNFTSQLASGTCHKNGSLAGRTGVYGISHTILAASGFAAGNSYIGVAAYNTQGGAARRQAFQFNVI